MGGLEVVVVGALFWCSVVFALYWVIRLGVRHGSLDALRQAERERVPSSLPVGGEPSPNSR
jgi:hypothetical protein